MEKSLHLNILKIAFRKKNNASMRLNSVTGQLSVNCGLIKKGFSVTSYLENMSVKEQRAEFVLQQAEADETTDVTESVHTQIRGSTLARRVESLLSGLKQRISFENLFQFFN